jgi:GGDEF domain-containing protein
MPGRVRADEYLATLISQAPSIPPSRQPDAAIVDIRHFADYNGAYGYELGDQLLQELASVLRTEIVRSDSSTFIAHLSDDRFLILAPAGVLRERIPCLVTRFEQSAVNLSATPVAAPHGEPVRGGVGLRIILIPGAALHISEPRELFRIASRIRERNDLVATESLGDHSQLVVNHRTVAKARLSA